MKGTKQRNEGFWKKTWGKIGCLVIFIGIVVVSLLFENILIALSRLPIIGFVARIILYLRGTAY